MREILYSKMSEISLIEEVKLVVVNFLEIVFINVIKYI